MSFAFLRAPRHDLGVPHEATSSTISTDGASDPDLAAHLFYQSLVNREGTATPTAVAKRKRQRSPPATAPPAEEAPTVTRCHRVRPEARPAATRRQYYRQMTPPSSSNDEDDDAIGRCEPCVPATTAVGLRPALRRPRPPSPAAPVYCAACGDFVTAKEEHEMTTAHLFNAQAKAETLITYSMDASNPGRRMLELQGWVPHTGLGKCGHGMLAPLATRFKSDRRGLGNAPLSAKRRTHTTADIEAVKARVREQRRTEPPPPPLTAAQRTRQLARDRERDALLQELLHTDTFEALHPGQPLPL